MLPTLDSFFRKALMNILFAGRYHRKQLLLVCEQKKIIRRNFSLAILASCLPKCENSFRQNVLPLKYYCTREQHK